MQILIGYRVAHELEEATGMESRVTVLWILTERRNTGMHDRVLQQNLAAAAHMLAWENW